ncbi:MAG: SEC-C metal-binding domain-containing protein [bacterium]
MRKLLIKVGSSRTLHEIYGLFYGCVGAPHMVAPSRYLPVIFDGKEPEFESMEKTKQILGGLMALWNILAGWQPEEETFYFPESSYPATLEGLKMRVRDDRSFMEFFMKGLDLGETRDEDFSGDALGAMEHLAGLAAYLRQYEELLETEDTEKEEPAEKSLELFDKMEDSLVHGMARIIAGLKEARVRAAEEMRNAARMGRGAGHARSSKIGRNEPCPCGSGKKYKKCCAGRG